VAFQMRCAFIEELGDRVTNKEEIRKRLTSDIEANRIYFWVKYNKKEGQEEETVLVSTAGITRETNDAMSVSGVYTPPVFRKQGYATTLVAHLSKLILEQFGKKYCYLFTDVANPTSNSIYRKIGYEPIAEFHHYKCVGKDQ